MLRFVVPSILVLALQGCVNVRPPEFGKDDTGGPDVADTDTDTDTDTDSDSDSDTDTGETGEDTAASFDDPGDLVDYVDVDGVVEVDLTDASGDSNQGQEFFLVVVNTTASEVGYRLRYYDAAQERAELPGRPPSGAASARPTRARPVRPVGPVLPVAAPPPPPPLDATDIGVTKNEFLVRDHLEQTTSYATVLATLWAIGDNVEIWVDDDVAIDWDQDCDGDIDIAHPNPAYGFDNCDLADVAEIIDTNIIPNVRGLYGDESDVNGDGRVSVVITPVLNAITITSEDEDDFSRILPSYAEPQVDLAEFDRVENPGSDMQEVLYVFAPDPNGFFNVHTGPDGPTVEAFTGYQLAAEVARSFTSLVSYNQHYLLQGGQVESDWVIDILGTFAAEYCGFGAAYHRDAWEYVDAPHLYSLASGGDPGSLATLSRGAQYLFGTWLYQQAEATSPGSGATLMADIMQTDTSGVDSIEGAVSAGGGTFDTLVLGWQVALMTSGVTTVDGAALVDPAEWAPYGPAVTISAPPDAPGGFYGANGYQSGINVNGSNRAYQGGTTDAPTELSDRLVKLENTDAFVYTPGFEFVGWMGSDYTAHVVRLTGINYDEALVELQATGTGLLGAVVRANDPQIPDFAIENSLSVTEANAVALPQLPLGGGRVYGLGEITAPGATFSVGEDGTEEVEVADTDRWLLDLTGRSPTESITVAVWLDRQFADTSGEMGPEDPWIAVAPRELVPEPTVLGTRSGDTCTGGAEFEYPYSLLEHLTAQLFLSSTMYSGDEDDFDPCGERAAAPTTCDFDWDRDGVLDADEPVPESFLAQARVMECTLNGNEPPALWAYDASWLDMDELDDDDLPTINFAQNTGGRTGPDGEEGYVEVTLVGGREYLVIVGANDGGTGTYELNLREID
ncbi:MAG: hypothetical protein Q8P18_02190 [Pseudomonadota bacterium]|nr:hypothetical protein [Pseudomonadota bacterium]